MTPDDHALTDVLRMPVYGPGSSFSDVLKATTPELLPPIETDGHVHAPEGTTVIALRFAEGVIVAGGRPKGSRSRTGRSRRSSPRTT
jgi:hypothetical protein